MVPAQAISLMTTSPVPGPRKMSGVVGVEVVIKVEVGVSGVEVFIMISGVGVEVGAMS